MDSSAFNKFPTTALIWWALIGLIATGVVGITGFGWIVWFVVNHVRII